MTATEPSGRPEPGEFASYAAADIACVEGDDAVDVLKNQSEQVIDLLRGLKDPAVKGVTYAQGKWTLKEVIGHMIDDERIFAYRWLCVARREPLPLPGFEEKDYVAATNFEQRPLASLTAEYIIVRSATIVFLQTLEPDEWLRRGIVNGYEASVRGLAFHIAGHELHHLRILREKYLPLVPAVPSTRLRGEGAEGG
jgi:hypothetical protein